MAVAHVRNHTGGQTKDTGTTLVTALAANVPAGNTLVLHSAIDNLSGTTTPDISSITVPGGESATWVQLGTHDAPSSTGANSLIGETWAITTTQEWLSSFTPTITYSGGRNAKAAVIAEFSGVTTTLRGSSAVGTSLAGAPTATATGPEAGDLVIGGSSFETATAPTGDSDTTNGSWSTILTVGTTGALDQSNLTAGLQYKIVTGTGSQTYNPTGTSNDAGVVVAALQAAITSVNITPADSAHGHSTESATLTQIHVAAPVDSAHGHTTEAPGITQTHQLAPTESAHGHGTESPTLTQVHELAPTDTAHTHAADASEIGSDADLSAAGSTHSHASESPTVTQVHELTPADSSHGHATDSPTLTQAHALTPSDTAHAHTAGSPALTQVHALLPSDTAHGHASDLAAISQAHALTALDSLHTHTSDGTTFTIGPIVTPASRTSTAPASNRTSTALATSRTSTASASSRTSSN